MDSKTKIFLIQYSIKIQTVNICLISHLTQSKYFFAKYIMKYNQGTQIDNNKYICIFSKIFVVLCYENILHLLRDKYFRSITRLSCHHQCQCSRQKCFIIDANFLQVHLILLWKKAARAGWNINISSNKQIILHD